MDVTLHEIPSELLDLARERDRLWRLKNRRFNEWLEEFKALPPNERRAAAAAVRLRAERGYQAANDAFHHACPDSEMRRAIQRVIEGDEARAS